MVLAFGANLGTGVDVLELTPQDMREAWASALRRAQSHDPSNFSLLPCLPPSIPLLRDLLLPVLLLHDLSHVRVRCSGESHCKQ